MKIYSHRVQEQQYAAGNEHNKYNLIWLFIKPAYTHLTHLIPVTILLRLLVNILFRWDAWISRF